MLYTGSMDETSYKMLFWLERTEVYAFPMLLSVRYSNEQLFYAIVVHPFGQQSQIVIYRQPVAQPGMAFLLLEKHKGKFCSLLHKILYGDKMNVSHCMDGS